MANETENHQDLRKPKSRIGWLFAILAVLVILLAVFAGWLPRRRQQEEIDRRAKQESDAIPKVRVLKVRRARLPAS
jgi:hypothetical protein